MLTLLIDHYLRYETQADAVQLVRYLRRHPVEYRYLTEQEFRVVSAAERRAYNVIRDNMARREKRRDRGYAHVQAGIDDYAEYYNKLMREEDQ